MHEEGADGSGPVDCAKGVLNVGGYEKLVRGSKSHGAEVIDHAVGAAF